MTDEEAKEPEKTIDDLLGEFDQKEKPQTKGEMGEVVQFVKDFKQKEVQKDIRSGLDDAVQFIKTDETITVSDRMVRGFLNAMADDDPRLLDAFNQREANPGAWKEVLKRAQAEIKAEISTDSKITDDVNAAKAAASGQTNDEPEPKKITNADLNPLSDVQFKEFKKALGGGKSEEEALKLVK